MFQALYSEKRGRSCFLIPSQYWSTINLHRLLSQQGGSRIEINNLLIINFIFISKLDLLYDLRDYHSLWSLFHISSAKDANNK